MVGRGWGDTTIQQKAKAPYAPSTQENPRTSTTETRKYCGSDTAKSTENRLVATERAVNTTSDTASYILDGTASCSQTDKQSRVIQKL